MGRKTPDLADQRFGRLRVLVRDKNAPGPHAKWLCLCDCGTITSAGSGALRTGMTQSCGCLHSERTAASNVARAQVRRVTKPRPRQADPAAWRSSSRSYGTWRNMLRRCTDPDDPRYPGWGGRGIKVCDRWLDFGNFLTDMGERPAGKTLDRIDNHGNYEPGNCRWATPHEQQVNSRNFKLTPDVINAVKQLREQDLSMTAIGQRLGLNRKTVARALNGKGRSRAREG